ncbi:unnamed protein product [Calypogeia fissa]
MAPVDVAAKQKAKKQANFSNIEIEQIARSWLACSSCSSVGAQQKSDVYWSKIEQHFQKAGGLQKEVSKCGQECPTVYQVTGLQVV